MKHTCINDKSYIKGIYIIKRQYNHDKHRHNDNGLYFHHN